MFTVINFAEEVQGTFSSLNAAIQAASLVSTAQWVQNEKGEILFIKRRVRKGKPSRTILPEGYEGYNDVTWNPQDLLASKQACEILINRGLGLDTLKTLNFGNLDVDSVYREYFSLPDNEPSINQLKAEINRLKAEITCREAGLENKNTPILMEEVRNLLQGVGEGFIAGNYYAPSRYYSRIEGVKNIRRASFDGEPNILVKVTSPKGELLPKQIMVEGTTYKIVYIESRKYKGKIDY